MPNLSHNFASHDNSLPNKRSFWQRLQRLLKKKKRVEADNFRKEKEKVASYAEVVKKEKNKRIKTKSTPAKTDKKNLVEKMGKKFKTASNGWQAPSILKTNLVKNEVTTFINWKKNIIILSGTLMAAILIIAALYGGLMFWEKNARQKEQILNTEIVELKKAISETKTKMKEVDAFRERLQLAGELLNKHIYWTNFFKFLEENILPDVYLTSDFSGTPDGKYSFPALTKNFGRLADQIRVLRTNRNIISATVNGGSLADKKGAETENSSMINFTLNIKAKPEIFYK